MEMQKPVKSDSKCAASVSTASEFEMMPPAIFQR
jgi:hypothetical protein